MWQLQQGLFLEESIAVGCLWEGAKELQVWREKKTFVCCFIFLTTMGNILPHVYICLRLLSVAVINTDHKQLGEEIYFILQLTVHH